uniref:Uncharacterized protein n=1 Tax=Meloidogyne floridensis TaxID=298350 RepID=A0A915NNI4_9BILA
MVKQKQLFYCFLTTLVLSTFDILFSFIGICFNGNSFSFQHFFDAFSLPFEINKSVADFFILSLLRMVLMFVGCSILPYSLPALQCVSIISCFMPLQYIGNIILISSNILFSVLCHIIWFKFLQNDEEFDNNYKHLEEEDEEKGVFVLPSTDKQNNNKANFNKDNSFNNVEKQCPQLASDVEQNVTTNNDGQPIPSLAWPNYIPFSDEIEKSKETFNLQLEQTLDEFLEKLKLMGFVENNEKINQKIKETEKDFENLQKQLDSTKKELKKCQEGRDALQRYSMMHVIPMLPQEQQGSALSAMEMAKAVGPQENKQGNLFQQSCLSKIMPGLMNSLANQAANFNAQLLNILNKDALTLSNNLSKNPSLDTSATNNPWSFLTSMPSSMLIPSSSSSAHESALKEFVNEKSSNETLEKTGKKLGNKPEPNYAFKIVPGEEIIPVVFPSDASSKPDLPKQRVFTGGKGQVKVWDINNVTSLTSTDKNVRNLDSMATFPCLKDSYIRSCKLFSDGSTLIVGGETKTICILDVERGGEIKQTFDCEAEACYALAISQDCKTLFSCCSNGVVNVWDLTCGERIVQLIGHSDGASCVDISGDGQKLWTGGLDNTVRCWDIASRRQFSCQEIESQVFSISCCPTDNWVAVGLEDNNVQVIQLEYLKINLTI